VISPAVIDVEKLYVELKIRALFVATAFVIFITAGFFKVNVSILVIIAITELLRVYLSAYFTSRDMCNLLEQESIILAAIAAISKSARLNATYIANFLAKKKELAASVIFKKIFAIQQSQNVDFRDAVRQVQKLLPADNIFVTFLDIFLAIESERVAANIVSLITRMYQSKHHIIASSIKNKSAVIALTVSFLPTLFVLFTFNAAVFDMISILAIFTVFVWVCSKFFPTISLDPQIEQKRIVYLHELFAEISKGHNAEFAFMKIRPYYDPVLEKDLIVSFIRSLAVQSTKNTCEPLQSLLVFLNEINVSFGDLLAHYHEIFAAPKYLIPINSFISSMLSLTFLLLAKVVGAGGFTTIIDPGTVIVPLIQNNLTNFIMGSVIAFFAPVMLLRRAKVKGWLLYGIFSCAAFMGGLGVMIMLIFRFAGYSPAFSGISAVLTPFAVPNLKKILF